MSVRFIEVLVEANPLVAEEVCLRFRAEGEPRPVSRLRFPSGPGEQLACTVEGWSSAGGGTPCAAQAIQVEDSSAGVATLVWGGDWGLRLTPDDGSEPFGEPYLLLDAAMLSGG